jgi:tRNA U34 5-methylaminomethyl-2-thiouridine-forming methyltransferase MnmC
MEKRDLGIRTTGDGSYTFYSDRFQQYYHSLYGARTESQRVFMDLGYGLASSLFSSIRLLEVGFGTGLNAWLSGLAAETVPTFYTGIEAYPIEEEQWTCFPEELQAYHAISWEVEHTIHPLFSVIKHRTRLEEFTPEKRFNLVYYDAFSPEAQPELWTEERFSQVHAWMETGGILSTYCSKVVVQHNLKSAGFEVEKHQGPPHKREVIRAIKK